MAFWTRRSHVTSELRDALQLAPGERILASAGAAAGMTVVATDHALYVPERFGHRRIGWEQVDRAGWEHEGGTLWVLETAPLGSRPRRTTMHVEEAGDVVDVVRERVGATVVIVRHVPISGEAGIRVVGRRPPGQDELTWTVAVDDGVDVSDPDVLARVEAAVLAAKSDVGAA
jgi:hypothetical protein